MFVCDFCYDGFDDDSEIKFKCDKCSSNYCKTCPNSFKIDSTVYCRRCVPEDFLIKNNSKKNRRILKERKEEEKRYFKFMKSMEQEEKFPCKYCKTLLIPHYDAKYKCNDCRQYVCESCPDEIIEERKYVSAIYCTDCAPEWLVEEIAEKEMKLKATMEKYDEIVKNSL